MGIPILELLYILFVKRISWVNHAAFILNRYYDEENTTVEFIDVYINIVVHTANNILKRLVVIVIHVG